MNTPHKIVVFDLDETLGYFTEFGIFCDCLNTYFKNNNYSEQHFNSLLDLYPEFVRPKLFKILDYLKTKKMNNKCKKIMIYTNNQGIGNKSVHVKERTNFETIMESEFKRYNYEVIKKTEKEQEIDNIVGKMMMQHLKKFFYEQTDKTYKRKPNTKIKSKNKTVKR